jgi:hypothetical protein
MTKLQEREETIWHPVRGFPGYSINREGEVRHDKNERILQPRYNQYGVPYVGLMRNWRQCSRSLPRLVATTFVSEPTDIFNTPIQIDGNPLNCHADNIMWRPRWYAVLYKRQFEERYFDPIDERIIVVDGHETFPDSFSAACRFGLLEREVVLSIKNNTPAWPTYQKFELAEMH